MALGHPRRVAMISMHTSPLATPGVGDAGGLNVYVAEVSRRLGERGIKVDVFTRAEDSTAREIVEVNEHTRVITVPAGPREAGVQGGAARDLVPEFAARLDAVIEGYDLIHTPLLAVRPGRWPSSSERHGVPLVHTMHTMARVKNASPGRRPADRARRTRARRGRHRREAARADRQHHATRRPSSSTIYGAQPDQITIVPPGVDLHTFHPCDQPKSRAQLGVPQDAQVILFVGRIQPLKAPDVLIRAVAELARREPARRDRLRLIIIGSPSGPDSGWSPDPGAAGRRARASPTWSTSGRTPSAPSCSAGTAPPTWSGCPPTTSPSGWSLSRPRPAAGRWWRPTSADCGTRFKIRQTGLLVAGHDPSGWADALAVGAGRPGRTGPDGRQRRRPRVHVQLGQHRRRDAAARTRWPTVDQRSPVRPDCCRVVGVLGGQRLGDALQRLTFGLDPEDALDHPADDHQRRADEVADGDLGDVPRAGGVLDQGTEQQRPGDAAGRRADRVEEGDAQRAGLHREDLTGRQVRRTRPGRGEEEDDGPEQGQRDRGQRARASARRSPAAPRTGCRSRRSS